MFVKYSTIYNKKCVHTQLEVMFVNESVVIKVDKTNVIMCCWKRANFFFSNKVRGSRMGGGGMVVFHTRTAKWKVMMPGHAKSSGALCLLASKKSFFICCRKKTSVIRSFFANMLVDESCYMVRIFSILKSARLWEISLILWKLKYRRKMLFYVSNSEMLVVEEWRQHTVNKRIYQPRAGLPWQMRGR